MDDLTTQKDQARDLKRLQRQQRGKPDQFKSLRPKLTPLQEWQNNMGNGLKSPEDVKRQRAIDEIKSYQRVDNENLSDPVIKEAWENHLKDQGNKNGTFTDRRRKALGKIRNTLRNSKQVGLIGNILFFLLMAYAIPIDLLPFVSGGLSTMLDWILDVTFFIAVFFVLLITTGDVLGSLIGRKSMINIVQSIAEFIPIIDALPFHILAVILLYLDVKYGIMKLAKGHSPSPTSPS